MPKDDASIGQSSVTGAPVLTERNKIMGVENHNVHMTKCKPRNKKILKSLKSDFLIPIHLVLEQVHVHFLLSVAVHYIPKSLAFYLT